MEKHLKTDYSPQMLDYRDSQIVDDGLAEFLCGSHADQVSNNLLLYRTRNVHVGL